MRISDVVAGRYRILQPLGSGGFGDVFEAEDLYLSRRVAIKVPRSASAISEDVRKREARLAVGLNHPNLVRLYDLAPLDDGQLCVIREWVDGGSLSDLARDKGLALADALDAALATAQGLGALHAKQIIHRDIKPANVLVPVVNGRPQYLQAKLSDLGVAAFYQAPSDETQPDVAPGTIIGTLAYMSPEQFTAGTQTFATDIYGLGTLLFNLIYGHLPFPAGGNLSEMADRVLNATVIRPEHPHVSDALWELISKSLRKEPEHRPSLADFTAALQLARSTLVLGQSRRAELTQPRRTITAPEAKDRLTPAIATTGIATVASAAVLIGLKHSDAAVGCALIGAGLIVGLLYHLLAARRAKQYELVTRTVLGVSRRELLTESIIIEIDQLLDRCRQVDEKVLGSTIALCIEEFRDAKDLKDRQLALMNAMQLLDKLMTRLAPWYVKYERLLALLLSLLGIAPGVAKLLGLLAARP